MCLEDIFFTGENLCLMNPRSYLAGRVLLVMKALPLGVEDSFIFDIMEQIEKTDNLRNRA